MYANRWKMIENNSRILHACRIITNESHSTDQFRKLSNEQTLKLVGMQKQQPLVGKGI